MKEKHNSGNYNFSFSIPELDIFISFEHHSSNLQKFIKLWTALRKSREVIYSYSEFLERIMYEYDKGKFTHLGIKTVTEFIYFLVMKYDIRKKDKPKEEVSVKYLRSKVYHYRDPENKA